MSYNFKSRKPANFTAPRGSPVPDVTPIPGEVYHIIWDDPNARGNNIKNHDATNDWKFWKCLSKDGPKAVFQDLETGHKWDFTGVDYAGRPQPLSVYRFDKVSSAGGKRKTQRRKVQRRKSRRANNRKAGGMITSISRVGQMFPKASTSTIPRGFSAMTAMQSAPPLGLATKNPLAETAARKLNKTRNMLKGSLPFSQGKLVIELFTLIDKEGYEIAKDALKKNSKYSSILNFLKSNRIHLELKTVRRMKETLEPAQFVDFLKTFIHFDIEFLKGVKDLRWRQMKPLGISRKSLGEIFMAGTRKFWEKPSERVKKLVQERDGVIYSDIHEWEHCVEIQTLMTTIIELILLDLVGVEGLTEEKIRDYYNNDFMEKNKYLIDDLLSLMNQEDNIFVKEKDLNALKKQVTSNINCGIKIKPVTASSELTDSYRKYIIESVIPSHQRFIDMIQSNHNGNFLGACLVKKLTKAAQGYSASIGVATHKGGVQYIEDIQPVLDELIKYELIEQICEDFTSEDSNNTNVTQGTSFEDYIVVNALTFLESRDLALSTMPNLEKRPVRKPELLGGNKTRKSKSLISKRALKLRKTIRQRRLN